MKKKILRTAFSLILVLSFTIAFSVSSSALSMGSCHILPTGGSVQANCAMWNQNYNTYTDYRNLQSDISVVNGVNCSICIGAYTTRFWDGYSGEFWTNMETTTGYKAQTLWLSTNDYGNVSYGRGTYQYFHDQMGWNWRVEIKSWWNDGSGVNVAYRQLFHYGTQVTYS